MDSMIQEPLILASASPRRKELLARFGIPFTVVPSTVEEYVSPDLTPAEQVLSLARQKAVDVASHCEGLIIAADTLVAIDCIRGECVLGKPADNEQAADMLRMLSASRHRVYTGIVVYSTRHQRFAEAVECTDVWMQHLSEDEINRYVATGESLDKAGAYAAQGIGSVFIQRIEGCYHNVVGLPLFCLNKLLQELGRSLV